MSDCISQELLEGMEYSIDSLCDMDGKVVCVVIRERMAVESGISVKGRVISDPEIERHVRQILNAQHFIGPVDIQCFKTEKGIFFTEINPRIAGGLSLSMAATGNWFSWIKQMLDGKIVKPVSTKTGLVMMRTYEDVIVNEDDLIKEY